MRSMAFGLSQREAAALWHPSQHRAPDAGLRACARPPPDQPRLRPRLDAFAAIIDQIVEADLTLDPHSPDRPRPRLTFGGKFSQKNRM